MKRNKFHGFLNLLVAPHAGAWIETKLYFAIFIGHCLSPPTRGRGLKRLVCGLACGVGGRPHAGAWIETTDTSRFNGSQLVAPHAGAWIETQLSLTLHPNA